MPTVDRIYLDNAATSWPKPEAVYDTVDRYQRENGAAAGRSVYREANDVRQSVEKTRRKLQALLNAEDARRIIFTFNGTDSLNLALHGVLRQGDHVVTSVAEHNSVLRPLRHLEADGRIELTLVNCDGQGMVDPDEVRRSIRAHTSLVVLTHCSNVTGAIQPAAEIGEIARNHGVLFLLDAAQSLGHMPVDVGQLSADLVAAPGHKGLLGPLGTGILYLAPGVEDKLQTVRQGGTGTQSDDDRQPDTLPDKYESGNLNVPGIIGLGAALDEIGRRGPQKIHEHEQELTRQLLQNLHDVDGIEVFGPRDLAQRGGVVSFRIPGFGPQEVATALDTSARIQCRSGFHCAPRMHQALGTDTSGGTVRLSVGLFNTDYEIQRTTSAIAELVVAGDASSASCQRN